MSGFRFLLLTAPYDNFTALIPNDLSAFPALTFSDIAFALKNSGCKGTARGHQYFAEYGYLHGIEGKYTNSNFETRLFPSTLNHFAVSYEDRVAQVTAKSYRSQKKNEPVVKSQFFY